MSPLDSNNQKGVALIWVLIVLAVSTLAIVPMLKSISTAFKYEQIAKEQLINEYSAEAGMEWAAHQLLYTGIANGLDEGNPTWNGSVDINGRTIPILLTFVPLGTFIDEALPGVDVDHWIDAGNQLELKVIVPDDTNPKCEDDLWFIYDTVLFPSALYLPITSPTTVTETYYWHNNPTPPVGDTDSQENLPLDTTAPTAETVYNYDDDRDDEPGRLIQKGGKDEDEEDLGKMQTWRTAPFAQDTHIEGKAGLLYWWGMKDFDLTKVAAGTFYLREYKGGNNYEEIGEITKIESTWARVFDFRSTCRDVTIEGRLQLFADRVEILSFEIE